MNFSYQPAVSSHFGTSFPPPPCVSAFRHTHKSSQAQSLHAPMDKTLDTPGVPPSHQKFTAAHRAMLRFFPSAAGSQLPALNIHCSRFTIFFLFTLFRTLLHSPKTYLPSFQADPNSFSKTSGVGCPCRSISASSASWSAIQLSTFNCQLSTFHLLLFTTHFSPFCKKPHGAVSFSRSYRRLFPERFHAL